MECIEHVVSVVKNAEILVVGSPDDTTKPFVNKIRGCGELYYVDCVPDRGKGDAIRTGIMRARGKYIVEFDADLQFDAHDILFLLSPLVQGKADMTLGSRFMSGSHCQAGSTPFLRTLGNKIFSLYSSLVFGRKITDALAGLKAWRREITESFELTSFTFTYEIELFAKAIRKKYRVMDVPVRFCIRSKGKSKVGILKTGLRIIRDVLKFRLAHL